MTQYKGRRRSDAAIRRCGITSIRYPSTARIPTGSPQATPGTGWRKLSIPFHFTKLIQVAPGTVLPQFIRDVSVGILPQWRHHGCVRARRRGGHYDGRVHRRRKPGSPPENEKDDAVSVSYPTDRIDESPPGITPPLSTTPMSRATQIREHLGQHGRVDVLAGNRHQDHPAARPGDVLRSVVSLANSIPSLSSTPGLT